MARIAASPRLTIARRVKDVTRPLCDRLHARVQALRRANPPSVGSGARLDAGHCAQARGQAATAEHEARAGHDRCTSCIATSTWSPPPGIVELMQIT
jgi:hypothetical protein